MKKITFLLFALWICCGYSQKNQTGTAIAVGAGIGAITFLAADTGVKETAKEIAQFRSKEYIINNIIGKTNGKAIKFETESLASDNSGGIISIAFNCDEVNERGLILAFFGNNKNEYGVSSLAYAFRYIPLEEARMLLSRIDNLRKEEKKYLSSDTNVNNLYIDYEDIKFVIYQDSGSKIRVFWNGFEVVWEDTAFNRSKRRLDKWFNAK